MNTDLHIEQFEKWVPMHKDRLMACAIHLTGSSNDADDLFQDALFNAFRFRNSFEGDAAAFGGWLYTIMRNRFLSEYKRIQKIPEVRMSDFVFDNYEGDADKQTDYDLSDEMLAAVNSLPEKMRCAMLLCDIEGYSYQEIADELAISIGTVRSRLHRARTMAREHLLGSAPIRAPRVAKPKNVLELEVVPRPKPEPALVPELAAQAMRTLDIDKHLTYRRVQYPFNVLSMVE